jgi:hypothetical protein
MWEGIVSAVSEHEFTALVYDLDQPDIIQCGDFPFEAIAADQHHLVKPGATFLWSVEHQFKFGSVLNERELEKRLSRLAMHV